MLLSLKCDVHLLSGIGGKQSACNWPTGSSIKTLKCKLFTLHISVSLSTSTLQLKHTVMPHCLVPVVNKMHI